MQPTCDTDRGAAVFAWMLAILLVGVGVPAAKKPPAGRDPLRPYRRIVKWKGQP
jgi:hypothetical protein